jgi:hypothetical protein
MRPACSSSTWVPAVGRLTYSPHAWTVVEEPDNNGNYHRQTGRFSQE